MSRKRPIPCNQTPDTPEVLVSAEVRGWDDMGLMRALSVCPDSPEYLAELDRRRGFETAWTGQWQEDSAANWPSPSRDRKTLAEWHPEIAKKIASRKGRAQ